MKKVAFSMLLSTILFICPSWSQTLKNKNFSEKIDSLVALQHKPDEPGGVLAVIRGNEVLIQKTFGVSDVEQGTKIDKNTMFDLASVAKHFTAIAIMMLEEQGRLNLDADIRNYLPDMPEYEHPITVRHLLQHTSGLASTDWLRLFADMPLDMEWTHQDEVNLIKNYPQLNFKPNTSHVYSNAGYSLLASIVEAVSGMHFAGFLSQNIFDPLRMESSLVYLSNEAEIPALAKGYMRRGEQFLNISSVNDFSYGSGNIFSNLEDMIRWGLNFMNPVVGNEAMFSRMLNKYNTLENGDTLSYTYGLVVRSHRGVKLVDHGGGLPGFRSEFMIFPDERLMVIVMLNNQSIRSRALALDVAELFLEADLAEVAPPKPREEINLDAEKARRYEGTYQLEDEMEMTFTIEGDEFWLLVPGGHRLRLFPESETTFLQRDYGASLIFLPDEKGKMNEMKWRQRGQEIHGKRVEKADPISEDQLVLFTGPYYQACLGTPYPVVYEEGQLKIRLNGTFEKYLGMAELKLFHVRGDKFATDHLGMMRFTRDENGHVNGFILLDAGRMKNVVFMKK